MTWDEKSLSHVPELSHGTLGIHRNPATATQTDDADAAKLLLGDTKATIHGKEESVLHALSRMVYADTFLSADSSLSISAALMRPRGNLYMPREIVSGMHFAGKDIGYVKGNCSFILPPATQY